MNPNPDQRPDDDPPMQGEGNYAAGRRYDKAQRQFVKAGKVDDAARRAQPKDAHEQQKLSEAEKAGREKARK